MFEELHDIERRYEELAHGMSAPDLAENPTVFAQRMREYKELTPLIETYREYDRLCKETSELESAAGQSDLEDEFKVMLQQEICENARNKTRLESKLRLLLLPKDLDDEKSGILEIRAGAGGEEAALFAHSLWRMYAMYAAKNGWRTNVISLNETELGGVKELVLAVEGSGVFSKLKFESGVHRVQRVPGNRDTGPHSHLHRHSCGDAGSGRGGALSRPQGSAHRHVPLFRCRRDSISTRLPAPSG